MEEDYYILHTGCCSREAAYVFKLLLRAPFTDFIVLNRNENPAILVPDVSIKNKSNFLSRNISFMSVVRWIDDEIVVFYNLGNDNFKIGDWKEKIKKEMDKFLENGLFQLVSILEQAEREDFEKTGAYFLLPNLYISYKELYEYVSNTKNLKAFLFEHTSLKEIYKEILTVEKVKKIYRDFKSRKELKTKEDRVSDQFLLEGRRTVLENTVKTLDRFMEYFNCMPWSMPPYGDQPLAKIESDTVSCIFEKAGRKLYKILKERHAGTIPEDPEDSIIYRKIDAFFKGEEWKKICGMTDELKQAEKLLKLPSPKVVLHGYQEYKELLKWR